MIGSITQWIMDLLQSHGPASVFVGVIIESVIVPIPSPLIIMGAGAILIEPGLSWIQAVPLILAKIVVPGAIASTLGAFIGYGIGYWGGKPAIDKCQGFLGFGWEDVQAMEKRFVEGRVTLIIFSLRALPIVPLSLISAAAGAIRMPLQPFTLGTLLGSLPRCFLLGVLGWMTRDTYATLAKGLNFVEGVASGVIILFVCAAIFYLRRKMKARQP